MEEGRADSAMPLSVCQPWFRLISLKMARHDATQGYPSLLSLDTILIGNPMTFLSVWIVMNP